MLAVWLHRRKHKPLRSLYRVGLWVCALASATLVTVAVESSTPHFGPGAVLSIFLAAWVASYFVGHWVMVERPAELRKKYPLSSKELRRRDKEFYDNLPH
jgi:hypothetical protein